MFHQVYDEVVNGEPTKLGKESLMFLKCCDCGLVHLLLVERDKLDNVYITVFRDDFTTNNERKKKK